MTVPTRDTRGDIIRDIRRLSGQDRTPGEYTNASRADLLRLRRRLTPSGGVSAQPYDSPTGFQLIGPYNPPPASSSISGPAPAAPFAPASAAVPASVLPLGSAPVLFNQPPTPGDPQQQQAAGPNLAVWALIAVAAILLMGGK